MAVVLIIIMLNMTPAIAVQINPENQTATIKDHWKLNLSTQLSDYAQKIRYIHDLNPEISIENQKRTKIITSANVQSKQKKSLDLIGMRHNATVLASKIQKVTTNCTKELDHLAVLDLQLKQDLSRAVEERSSIKADMDSFELTSNENNIKEHQKLENKYWKASEKIKRINKLRVENNRLKNFYTKKLQRYTKFGSTVEKVKTVTKKNAVNRINKMDKDYYKLINPDETLIDFYAKLPNTQSNGTVKYDKNGNEYANNLINRINKKYLCYVTHKSFTELHINDIVQLLRSHLISGKNSNYNYYKYQYYIFKGFKSDEYNDKFAVLKDSKGNEIKLPKTTFDSEYTGNLIEYNRTNDVYTVLRTIDQSIYDDWNDESTSKNAELDEVENNLILVNSAANALPLMTIPAGILLATLWAGLRPYVTLAVSKAAAANLAVAAAQAALVGSQAAVTAEVTAAVVTEGAVATSLAVKTAAASSLAATATGLSILSGILFWATVIISIVAILYMGYVVYKYFTSNNDAKKLKKELSTLNDVKPINPY